MAPSCFRSLLSLLVLLCLFISCTAAHYCEKVDEKKIPGHCRHKRHMINDCKQEKSATTHIGIPQILLDEFHLMSQYCAAAYVPYNTNSTDELLSCSEMHCKNVPEGNCPLVEKAKARTTIEWEDTPRFDNHGQSGLHLP